MVNFIIDEKKEAVRIEVELEGDTQTYALSFLHIFNNVRDNQDCMYRLENLSGTNRIFVTVSADFEEGAKNYLEQFGKIIGVVKCMYISVVNDYSTFAKCREFENFKDRLLENDISPIFYIPHYIYEY